MAHPARRHRVPQDGDAHEGTFELLDFELEPGDMDASSALDRASTAAPVRTQTHSPTSPTDLEPIRLRNDARRAAKGLSGRLHGPPDVRNRYVLRREDTMQWSWAVWTGPDELLRVWGSSHLMKCATPSCTRDDRTTATRVGAQLLLTSFSKRRTLPQEMHRRTMHRETEQRRGMVSWAVRTCQGNARAIRETFCP